MGLSHVYSKVCFQNSSFTETSCLCTEGAQRSTRRTGETAGARLQLLVFFFKYDLSTTVMKPLLFWALRNHLSVFLPCFLRLTSEEQRESRGEGRGLGGVPGTWSFISLSLSLLLSHSILGFRKKKTFPLTSRQMPTQGMKLAGKGTGKREGWEGRRTSGWAKCGDESGRWKKVEEERETQGWDGQSEWERSAGRMEN